MFCERRQFERSRFALSSRLSRAKSKETQRGVCVSRPGCAIKLAVFGILAAGMVSFPTTASAQQAGQKTFSSAAEASTALIAAVKANDQQALLSILGPDAKPLISSGDNAEDQNDRKEFVEKYQQMHRMVSEPDGMTTLHRC